MPKAVTSAAMIAIAERRALALDARKQGFNFVQIAEYLRTQPGVSPAYNVGQAYKDVIHELRRIVAEASETASDVLRLQLERYDTLLSAWWPKAVDEDRLDPVAFDKVLVIMAKIEALVGLNRPQQVQVTGPSDGPVKVRFDVSQLPIELLRAIAYEREGGSDTGGLSVPSGAGETG